MDKLTIVLIAIIGIAFVTNLAVELAKQTFKDFPSNILVVIVASVVTILAFIGYATYVKLVVEGYMIVGVIAGCIAESYIAMFGYDKFIQTFKQYKDYIGKV